MKLSTYSPKKAENKKVVIVDAQMDKYVFNVARCLPSPFSAKIPLKLGQ